MARSDLLLELASASQAGDSSVVRRAIETLAAEERRKGHDVLADRLEETLARGELVPRGPSGRATAFAHHVVPRRDLCSVTLGESTRGLLKEVVEEQQRAELLASYGLAPRHRVLLSGPPGNGKTTVAEALAFELAVPLYIARYESLIGSFLGETAARVAELLDFVRARQCVLFFDEFDAIAKERADTQETGEVKRVVSSLLMNLDSLPSHVLVVTATNHPELLDRAVWRRFQVRVNLPSPTPAQRAAFLKSKFALSSDTKDLPVETLARELTSHSYSELEEFYLDVRRRLVLSGPDAKVRSVVRACLRQWKQRSLVSSG